VKFTLGEIAVPYHSTTIKCTMVYISCIYFVYRVSIRIQSYRKSGSFVLRLFHCMQAAPGRGVNLVTLFIFKPRTISQKD
jgi:hypothetical protein